MLKASYVPIDRAISHFDAAGVTYGLLVPTQTGYKKAIMDATFGFRYFLKTTDIHDFAKQGQGQACKVSVPAYFVYRDKLKPTLASLYRPKTKQGDPRIWFSRLTHYCKPTDLLVVIANDGALYVFNMSDQTLVSSFETPGTFPYDILQDCANELSPIAAELLGKLRKIHAQGFIRGVSHGDTNVGMTLERLLSIPPNAAKAPDYKGIELKASRKLGQQVTDASKRKSGRIPLFTQTPDWQRSPMQAADILRNFGYYNADKKRRQLYCTITNTPNPQGLYLDAGDEVDLWNRAQTSGFCGNVAVWALETLRERMLEKHRETFWIRASSQFTNGIEYLRYDAVRHTRSPNVGNLGNYFDAGMISVDYTLSGRPRGGVRDHGYIFKVASDKFHHLFPLEKVYILEQHGDISEP